MIGAWLPCEDLRFGPGWSARVDAAMQTIRTPKRLGTRTCERGGG
jgi:hypothetical protein